MGRRYTLGVGHLYESDSAVELIFQWIAVKTLGIRASAGAPLIDSKGALSK